ncbi:hypothetical protein [Erwinia rhapontici]|nr:hypothetical protein [Erwinia rhapontici]
MKNGEGEQGEHFFIKSFFSGEVKIFWCGRAGRDLSNGTEPTEKFL